MTSSHASNPACSPIVTQSSNSTRNYVFTDPGTCDFTWPKDGYLNFIEAIGGGGGGGGGGWNGSSTGAGGGGGGAGVINYENYTWASGGSTFTITVGAGGQSGAGAGIQYDFGTAGANGGSSSVISTVTTRSSTSTTIYAPGGNGGTGGSGDTGGAGGNSRTAGNSQATLGGSQSNGNGGGGATVFSGNPAGSGYPGNGQSAQALPVYPGVNVQASGQGGTSEVSQSGNSSQGVWGATSARDASSASTPASGGGGGHGCKATTSVCEHRDGGSGSNGIVIMNFKFTPVVTGGNNVFHYNVGSSVNNTSISPSAGVGTTSVLISPSLPAGLTLDPTTGVISGTPTTTSPLTGYTIIMHDSLGDSSDGRGLFIDVNKGGQSSLSLAGGSLTYNTPTTLAATGGSGTGIISYSTNSATCSLSGSNKSVVTATSSSGTCVVTATKAGDSNYNSAAVQASFTISKAVPTISISAASNPLLAGSADTITVTMNSGLTGTLTFKAGGNNISYCGNGGIVTIASTTATCKWVPNASGSPYAIQVLYSGNSSYQSATISGLTVVVNPTISLSYPSINTIYGTGASQSAIVSGGTGSSSNWSWSIVRTSDGLAQSGITIDSSGTVQTSSSLAAGTYSMLVSTTDAASVTQTSEINIGIGTSSASGLTLALSASTIDVGTVETLTASVVSTASGTITFKYGGTTITSCGSSGAVTISSGIATCVYSWSSSSGSPFSITATYSGGGNYSSSVSAAQVLTVNARPSLTASDITSTYGTSFTQAVIATGGTNSPETWTWKVLKTSDSSSISGLSISPSGVISGSSSIYAGTYAVTVSAIDGIGVSVSTNLSIVINKASPVLTLTPQNLATGATVAGATSGRSSYFAVTTNIPGNGSATVYANGTAICSYVSIFGGSGTCFATLSGSIGTQYSIYASMDGTSNNNFNSATSATITNFTLNDSLNASWDSTTVWQGSVATITPTISGGTGSRSSWTWNFFQQTIGDQIGGITMNNQGTISIANDTAPGTYSMSATAIDAVGASWTQFVSITITPLSAPEITLSTDSETATVNSPIIGFTVTNVGGPATYAADSALPNGLSLSVSSGTLSGTPTVAQAQLTLTITASNVMGSSSQTFTIIINNGSGSPTLTLSIAGGSLSYRTSANLTASISQAGVVTFYQNGKRIPGCISLRGNSSIVCIYRPMSHGTVNLKAILKTSSGGNIVNSNVVSAGVGRRTGSR